MKSAFRELWFLSRDRAGLLWIALAFASACLAVVFGLSEISEQRSTIERLQAADQIEQSIALEEYRD
ncbi:MAG: hypothetical protein AAGI03_15115, partial [Pseudomonadota bacterium]